jgi:PKD repeat protein
VFERRRQARRKLREFELLRHVAQTEEYIVLVPAGQTEAQVAQALMQTGNFEYAEPDWRLYPISSAPSAQSVQVQLGAGAQLPRQWIPRCPDDPLFPAQWHHAAERVASCQGWLLTTGTPAVSGGVCDTGLRTSHQDLQLHRLEAYNAVDRLWESEGGQIGPVHYHGTRTTGTVAANGNNGVGVAGLGWDLSHRMIRVSNQSDGGAYLSDLQHGARTSIESGDRVANVSYHGAASGSNWTTATYIKSIGGLLLWGAGNTSANYSHVDRDADDLIVVGATDQNDALASFSVYGTFVDLVAPGVGILTTDSGFDSDYATADGTSYACPLTSGVCALIWSARPSLSPNDVELILKAGADDIGAPGIDDIFGYGRINLVESLLESGSAPPAAEFAGQPASGVSPLLVQFRDLSSGVPTAWSWDFGDGSTSTEQNPSHTYASSGAFTVSLAASNALGSDQDVLVDYVLVDIIPPKAEFSGAPTLGLSPLTVQFTDESAGGVPTTWLWDFGDGQTSTLPEPAHTYTIAGSYSVRLTVTNAYGSDQLLRVNYIDVGAGPPLSGPAPLTVDFRDLSIGNITGWEWNFGDGGGSALQHPTYVFTTPGEYDIALQVGNVDGADSGIEKQKYVIVQ